MPLGYRRKYLGRNRSRDGPYSCPMCGEMDESLQLFFYGIVGSCAWKYLVRRLGERDWIYKILRRRFYLTINNIGKFVRVGMRYCDVFLNN